MTTEDVYTRNLFQRKTPQYPTFTILNLHFYQHR